MNGHIFITKGNDNAGDGKIVYPHLLAIHVTSTDKALEMIHTLSGGLYTGPTPSEERPIQLILPGDFTGEETTAARLDTALKLLERATTQFEDSEPDENWFRDYFILIGQHAILTDEGWITGQTYEQTDDQYKPEILDEINNPNGIDRSFPRWRGMLLQGAREGREIEFENIVYVIVEVFEQGLHLTRGGADAGVFSFEELKRQGAVLKGE